MIKAEFWADEKIGSCSFAAQLLFIGSWTFADDSGVCRANVIFLRNNIFPYSSITTKQVEIALNELIEKQLIFIGEYQNEKYLIIKNWHHQTIKKPSSFRHINENYESIFKGYKNNLYQYPTTTPPVDHQLPPKVKVKEKEKEKEKVKEKVEVEVEEKSTNVTPKKIKIYGEYANVALFDDEFQALICECQSKELLKELIDELSEKIEIGKESYKISQGEGHFARIRSFLKYRRQNPDKFKKQTVNYKTPERTKQEIAKSFEEKQSNLWDEFKDIPVVDLEKFRNDDSRSS